MKGSYPKKLEATDLLCSVCAHFREDDPDIYYCEIHEEDFPNLCFRFVSRVKPAIELENPGRAV